MCNKDTELISQLISKLDIAVGKLLVAAMKDKTVKEAMEAVSEVSFELSTMI